QLQSLISRKKPGQLVHLKVVSYSDKKERAVRVEIGELPGEGAGPRRPGPGAGQPDRLGLVVAPTKQGDGVLVEMVRPGSLAAQIGLEAGDVILRVNRRVVKNVQDYRKAVQSARRLYMEVRRKGRRLFFQFSVPRE